MIEAVAGVMRLRNDRIERGTIERCVHLVGDLDEAAVEHRKRDRIERRHRRTPVFLPDGRGVSYRSPNAIISGVPMRSLRPSKSSMRERNGCGGRWGAGAGAGVA